MKNEEKTQDTNIVIKNAIDFKKEMERITTSFRIAAWIKSTLILLAEKTGVPLGNIVEVATIEYLRKRDIVLPDESEKDKDGMLEQLQKLKPAQIYKLLTIHLRRLNDSLDFRSDTGIDSNAKGFQYYNSVALLDIFGVYFKKNKLDIPSMEILVKHAAIGYKIAAFGGPKLIKMSDEELKEILLAVAK